MSAEPYGIGTDCTWHGPLTFAAIGKTVDESATHCSDEPLCPSCFRPLTVTTVEQFWENVAAAEKQRPGYELLMTWSEGKCYPDFDTLENVWRQAMEE